MAASKKSDKLADLTASLAARTARPAPPPPRPGEPDPAAVPAPAPAAKDALMPNQTVSLYESDLDLLETLRAWMSRRGLRNCGASEAVRLCVRLAVQEANAEALAELCRQGRTRDGRRRGASGRG